MITPKTKDLLMLDDVCRDCTARANSDEAVVEMLIDKIKELTEELRELQEADVSETYC